MKTTILSACSVFLILIIFISCSQEEITPNVSKSTLSLSTPDYNYLAVSQSEGYLGRVLFYDKSVSVNNSISCASCHNQALAFSDHKRFSSGFESLTTSRNSPPIQNLMGAFGNGDIGFGTTGNQSLFWDGRENKLEEMVLKPITHNTEMGMRSPEDLVGKLKSTSYYPVLFENAFGSENITVDRISKALAGFVASIESNKSRFDINQNTLVNSFSEQEKRGQDLFFGTYNCNSCHNLLLPTGYDPSSLSNEMVNIGLEMQTEDAGFGGVTQSSGDHGKFKIPNLRNVAVTGPYMHDGRFETLGEVIDHYSTEVKNSPNLDPRLKANGQPLVLNIPGEDKADLIAFLHTLTDQNLISNPKYSNPFEEE
jgi:cytochrome c peroxidase